MNEHVRNNCFFSSVKIFKERINDFFQTILPNIADSLDSRINDDFQRLNPAFSFPLGIADAVGYKATLNHDLSKPDGMRQKLIYDRKLQVFGWSDKTNLSSAIKKTI
jgi:hypothetical protein